MKKKFKPTARDFQAWWKRCEGHLTYCKKEDCDLRFFFTGFKQERQETRDALPRIGGGEEEVGE